MITHSITYTVDNATDFANNIGSTVVDTHTKKYRDTAATHFSSVSAFNSAVDAGHINAIKIIEDDSTHVTLSIIWNNTSEWLNYMKTNWVGEKGISINYRNTRALWNATINYSYDENNETARDHYEEWCNYVLKEVSQKEEHCNIFTLSALDDKHPQFAAPAEGWAIPSE